MPIFPLNSLFIRSATEHCSRHPMSASRSWLKAAFSVWLRRFLFNPVHCAMCNAKESPVAPGSNTTHDFRFTNYFEHQTTTTTTGLETQAKHRLLGNSSQMHNTTTELEQLAPPKTTTAKLNWNKTAPFWDQQPQTTNNDQPAATKHVESHAYQAWDRSLTWAPNRDHYTTFHQFPFFSFFFFSSARPDKGNGTVLMNKADYISKVMEILGNKTKFECLGGCDEHYRTGQNERSLQTYLLRQRKAGEISSDVYDQVRPTCSVRPRMYGLPKLHKPKPISLRTILSMVGSAEHEFAQWLAEVIRPVLNRYSSNVVKDSFSFCADLQDYGQVSDTALMCSFDVVSLFTTVPNNETLQICLDTLYCSDIKPPSISESVLKKLLWRLRAAWSSASMTRCTVKRMGYLWGRVGVGVGKYFSWILWMSHS